MNSWEKRIRERAKHSLCAYCSDGIDMLVEWIKAEIKEALVEAYDNGIEEVLKNRGIE